MLSLSLFPLPLSPLLLLYINLFFPSIALSTGNMWACQSYWLTELKWPTEKQLIFSFSLFSFFWSDVLVMPGPYQETQFIAVSLGKRGCHSHWLTALRFASCSVGISFKLLCFPFSSFFFPHVLSEIILQHMDIRKHFTHIHKNVEVLPRLRTVLFLSDLGGDFDWQTVIRGPAEHRAGQVQLCEHLCLGSCFILWGGGSRK